MIDAIVVRPSLAAGFAQVSVAGLANLAWVVPCAPSPAQVRGLCRPARILPRGDGFVQAGERAQDITPPFPPEHEFAALPVVLLQGS